MRTKDGKSRRFGFVGFRSEREAEEALNFFKNSFMGTSKITCEIARNVGDPELPRPWSCNSSKKAEKLIEENKAGDPEFLGHMNAQGVKKDRDDDDPRLLQYLTSRQPRIKSKFWDNDTLAAPPKINGKASNKQVQVKEEGRKKKASTATKIPGIHNQERRFDTLDDDVSEEVAAEKSSGNSDYDKNDSGELSSRFEDDNESLETGRLFVHDLPYMATEDDLEEHFSRFGNVSQVHLVVDKDTKRSKGYAYVLYSLPESATRALKELDKTIFQGRVLRVMAAKEKKSFKPQEINGIANNSKTFKKKREDERKASEASGNTRAWNSLFVNSDTVVENIARKFGVSKSVLHGKEATDHAVRLTLGEAHVIAETKKALVNAGVNIPLLEEFVAGKVKDVKRSDHVILAKNLPYASSESELANMFGKFGSLDKIILPPTKALGLVVFLQPAEAREAFRFLAYKRYKDTLFYLEWAPANVFSQDSTTMGDSNETGVEEKDAKKILLYQHGETDADIDPDRVESRSLFVKSLNFNTSDESLLKHFKENIKKGKILSVKVKKHLKNGKIVSAGYGFVEFDSVDTATTVCSDLQGTFLDGRALQLQRCDSKKDERVLNKVEKDQSSTKFIVRNVAFEATRKELLQLFSPFGQLKSLRLPKSFRSHRGFAFVEYATKQEAQSALQALSYTHLYSRRLLLERAAEGDTLEELRERTAAHFTDEQHGFQNPTKLSRKRKHVNFMDEGRVKFKRIAE